MKKKIVFFLVAAIAVTALVFTGCKTDPDPGPSGSTTKEWTVTFVIQQQADIPTTITAPDSVKVSGTGTLTLGEKYPGSPGSWDGYDFDGWFEGSADGTITGNEWKENTPVTKNLTLVSKYSEIVTPSGKVTVQFSLGAVQGTPPGYVQVDENTNLTTAQLAAPTVTVGDDWRFEGWYKGDDKFTTSTSVGTENITLTARWEIKITFDHNNKAADPDVTSDWIVRNVAIGSKLPAPNAHENAGEWTFAFWYDETHTDPTEEEHAVKATDTFDGPVTLKAHWAAFNAANNWVVEFRINYTGGTDPGDMQVPKDPGTLPALPAPERTNWRFDGWYLAEDTTFTTEKKAGDTIDDNIELVAKWTYTGTLEVSGNTLVHTAPPLTGNTAFNGTVTDNSFTGMSAGGVLYTFPSASNFPGTDFDIDDYDYFAVDYSVDAGANNETAVVFRNFANSADYMPHNGNHQPWLSGTPTLEFEVADGGGGLYITAAGSTSGFGLTISKVTFYIAPRYTVSFDLGYTEATGTPSPVSDFRGNWKGLDTLMPEDPTREHVDSGSTWYFLGWYNDSNILVAKDTPIGGNWTLTAKWSDEEPAQVAYVTASNNSTGIYSFVIPNGVAWADIKSITFKICATDPDDKEYFNINTNRIRGHVVAVPATGATPNLGDWGSARVLFVNNGGGASFDYHFESGYELGTWKTFTWDFAGLNSGNLPTIPAGGGTIRLAPGLAIDQNQSPVRSFGYYMKDVALVLEASTIEAEELDNSTIGNAWTANTGGVTSAATRIFRNDPDPTH